MKIVPADATIAELEKTAGECEERAKTEPDRIATRLREKAKLCREWIAALKSENGGLSPKRTEAFSAIVVVNRRLH
jgi:hypothetical protein